MDPKVSKIIATITFILVGLGLMVAIFSNLPSLHSAKPSEAVVVVAGFLALNVWIIWLVGVIIFGLWSKEK